MFNFKTMFGYKNKKRCITFNQFPKKGSWGGGNQWLVGIISHLEDLGYSVNFKLGKKTDCVFISNSKGLTNTSFRSRKKNHLTFGIDELKRFKKKFPEVPCIQRINDSDIHRDTNSIDEIFGEVNKYCDYTIFISNWILKYHSQKWWKGDKPFSVINNGADSSLFNPKGGSEWDGKMPFKLVTHHWSDNLQKGFPTYKELDRLISEGLIENTELIVIGNYPKEINWKSAKLFAPMHGEQLASKLKSCHAYITGSSYEASGMHWIEGVQCGLPLLYSEKGGAIAELGKRYGIPFDGRLQDSVERIKQNYASHRNSVLNNTFSFEKMCIIYGKVIKQVLRAHS